MHKNQLMLTQGKGCTGLFKTEKLGTSCWENLGGKLTGKPRKLEQEHFLLSFYIGFLCALVRPERLLALLPMDQMLKSLKHFSDTERG